MYDSGAGEAGTGLGQGIGAILGGLIAHHVRTSQNNRDYNAILQNLASQQDNPAEYQAAHPLPQGLSRQGFNIYLKMLQDQAATQKHQSQIINSANYLMQNPNSKQLPANFYPEFANQQMNAIVSPTRAINAKQEADESVNAPAYQALQSTLLNSPEQYYGENHPISQFAKNNPDAWQHLVGQAKTQNELENYVNPMITARQQGLKLTGEQQKQSLEKTHEGRYAQETEDAHLMNIQKARMNNQAMQYQNKLHPLELQRQQLEMKHIQSQIDDTEKNLGLSKGGIARDIQDMDTLVKLGRLDPQTANTIINAKIEALRKSVPKSNATKETDSHIKEAATYARLKPEQRVVYDQQMNKQHIPQALKGGFW